MERSLVDWMRDNHAATRSGDRSRMAAVAERFDRMVRALLEPRRDAPVADVTGELMAQTVHGLPLTDEATVSVLCNWTAGDLGSLATSVGVIVQFPGGEPCRAGGRPCTGPGG
jgi:cytochrome P450